MRSDSFRFDRFVLDPDDRLLRRDGAVVEVNGRYLDALVLLVREHGTLVTKDRFFESVWRGIPVTDEALTQCVKTLRRQLGDSAADPRFIETVPKHGYRFVAPVERIASSAPAATADPQQPVLSARLPPRWRRLLLIGSAGTIGGGAAGAIGGLFYGLAGVSQPLQPGMGTASVLLVLLCVTVALALAGGAGVAFGIAAASFATTHRAAATMAGGAAGGLVVGTVVKLLGSDAFALLLGRSPGDITGAGEGLLLGLGVGVGAWLAGRSPTPSLRRGVVAAGLAGGCAGMLVPLLGGRLMAGSLDQLARHFPESRLRLHEIGTLFGEAGFGPVSQLLTGGLEGVLFAACIVAAMMLARRGLGEE